MKVGSYKDYQDLVRRGLVDISTCSVWKRIIIKILGINIVYINNQNHYIYGLIYKGKIYTDGFIGTGFESNQPQ